ncbi:MAG TPA: acyltransferase [Puia sp.]|uniref:acyltransferase family protein n=1 Tax=Puia sp. TaxID=2045100 RepID=UPI002CBBEEA6|nr:acyltransferase [Puia sp.]HVU98979.1 acyltransferase [Puia sp.]
MSKKAFNLNLEGLRGFAAIGVMVGHIFYHDKYFDDRYCPTILKSLVPNAHLEVLIFFVLSGFVIGISHPTRMQGASIREYLKKRLLRIYPIYLIGMLLSLFVAGFHYDARTIAANLTITQNISRPVIWEDNPAWSINYEMLYYLLFIPISFFRIRPVIAFVVALALGIISIYITPVPQLITGYFIGFSFWLIGLILAKNLQGNLQVRLLPLLFYILAIQNLFVHYRITSFFNRIRPIPDKPGFWYQTIVNINDLALMPFCFMIVLYFSGRTFKGKNLVFILLTLLPLRLMRGSWLLHERDSVLIFGIVYFALFLVTSAIPFFNKTVGMGLAKIGGISYAIYILHFPLLCLFGKIVLLDQPVVNYWVKLALYVPLVGIVSWALEKKFQPLLKHRILAKKLAVPEGL